MADFDANEFLNNEPASGATPSQPAAKPAAQPSSAFNANDFLGNEPGVGDAGVDQRLAQYDNLQAKYGTPGQQAIAGLEGLAQGVVGSIAPAAEVATGLTTPEAIRGREEANLVDHCLLALVLDALLVLLVRAQRPWLAWAMSQRLPKRLLKLKN